MNIKFLPTARRIVSPIMIAIFIVVTTLVVTFSSANSVVHAGDVIGGNAAIHFVTPTPTH